MSLISRAFTIVHSLRSSGVAHAHCDVPCGIYDPHLAQIAAHTVVRMDMLIDALDAPGAGASASENAEYANKLARYIAAKEDHAEIAKRELRILWGDYFKPEHLKDYPNVHDLFWDAMRAGSAARQGASSAAAQQLLKATQDIAEIFWKSKGINTVRQPSRQTSGGEIVYPS
ncbi:superoxide dismutase, Ni [SAR202 cluster bacterium AD-804-J14_MRT_500m]|nr:superoxide dismutase, Ni [SAR202 cluster bacterium AD-804-J14_MRT_500m]